MWIQNNSKYVVQVRQGSALIGIPKGQGVAMPETAVVPNLEGVVVYRGVNAPPQEDKPVVVETSKPELKPVAVVEAPKPEPVNTLQQTVEQVFQPRHEAKSDPEPKVAPVFQETAPKTRRGKRN